MTTQPRENRKPRPEFTRVLNTIAERLVTKNEGNVDFRDLYHQKLTAGVSLDALWVAGSYARGASTCGDLDLVLQFKKTTKSITPGITQVKTAFMGRWPRVHVYGGTPDDNTSGVPFPDAKLIWKAGDSIEEALARIASIQEDPSAGRMPRKHDAFPFRLDQINMALETVESWLEAKKSGEITWKFIPYDRIKPDDEWRATSRDDYLPQREASQKTQRALPLVSGFLTYLESKNPDSGGSQYGWRNFEYGTPANRYRWNDIRIQVGDFNSEPDVLMDLSINRVLVAIPPSRQGPNGMLMIERGKNHPLVQAMKNTTLWVEGNKNSGEVSFVTNIYGESYHNFPAILAASTKEEMNDYIDMVSEEDVESKPMMALEIRGRELLKTIASVDALTMVANWEDFPVTPYVEYALQSFYKEDACTHDSLIELLGLQKIFPKENNDENALEDSPCEFSC